MLNFSFCADLGPLGNYPGSPFLPSDSDILLDSPEQEDIGIPYLEFIFWSWWYFRRGLSLGLLSFFLSLKKEGIY